MRLSVIHRLKPLVRTTALGSLAVQFPFGTEGTLGHNRALANRAASNSCSHTELKVRARAQTRPMSEKPIMRLAMLLLFIALPILEIALLIRAGQFIGFWPTLGIVIATAIAGTYLLRQQGFQILRRLSSDLNAGRPPLEPIADGAMLLVAGAFLMTPGFVTDAAGLLLLVPQTRTLIRRAIVQRILSSPDIVVDVFTEHSDGSPAEGHRGPADPRSGRRPDPHSGSAPPSSGATVIEGEFERLDEKSRDPRR